MTEVPREFREIELFYSGLAMSWSVRSPTPENGPDDDYVRFIEKSALQAEQAKTRALEEKLAIAVDALDYYSSCGNCGSQNRQCTSRHDIALDALSKINSADAAKGVGR